MEGLFPYKLFPGINLQRISLYDSVSPTRT